MIAPYRCNAQGKADKLINTHIPNTLALGSAEESRQNAYCKLFRTDLAPHLVQAIRKATNGGYALGDNRSFARTRYTNGN